MDVLKIAAGLSTGTIAYFVLIDVGLPKTLSFVAAVILFATSIFLLVSSFVEVSQEENEERLPWKDWH